MKKPLALILCVIMLVILAAGCTDEPDERKIYIHNHHASPEGMGSVVVRNPGIQTIMVLLDGDGWYDIRKGYDLGFDVNPGTVELEIDVVSGGNGYTNIPICVAEGVVTEVTTLGLSNYSFQLTMRNRDGSSLSPECPIETQPLVTVNGGWELTCVPIGLTTDFTLQMGTAISGVSGLTGNIANGSTQGPTGSLRGSLEGYSIVFRASKADGTEYRFTGTVNQRGNSMSGTFTPANPDEDQWTAVKLWSSGPSQ